ncbi:Malonyl CoA-acyl carrier protein transacylase [Usitatibacter rugosus]|uniref:Malonyl CoA-acyl carrier protein transacylase n=1 Tax=Usitatibacter rugosus TaxID=2732067 RepID=A0A6M4GVD1_9PROT|nr:ACP S-malonyltransferase [Usitatibacter rugosus]QJR11126.1 Malonyl CoA-acyl carrier protein transacylase [Usitatibacter rugosus]
MTLAILFPGQGSQSLGMMQGFADLPVVEKTFREASALVDVDYWKMVTEGPAEALNQTVNTQPVMLIAGVACWRAWREKGGAMPAYFAGHSLGEYTALVASGVLKFEDAVPLVRFRAQSMQEAVPEGTGGIAAILGLDEPAIREVCAAAAQGEVLEPANLNSPGQIVIAGHRTAVERGMAAAKEKGAKRAVMLPMSAPSHCSLMKPAADRLAERLAALPMGKPQVPVVQNRDVQAFDDPTRIRQALVEQLYNPVRWIETVQFLASHGVTRMVECGPGKVLTGLSKRIAGDAEVIAINDTAALTAAATQG